MIVFGKIPGKKYIADPPPPTKKTKQTSKQLRVRFMKNMKCLEVILLTQKRKTSQIKIKCVQKTIDKSLIPLQDIQILIAQTSILLYQPLCMCHSRCQHKWICGTACTDTSASNFVAGETLYNLLKGQGVDFKPKLFTMSLANGSKLNGEVLYTELTIQVKG